MNNKTPNRLSGQSRDKSEAIFQLLIKRGFVGDYQFDDERVRTAQQKKRQNAFHNTELLLKQYKNLAWLMECFPDTIAAELELSFENIDEVIDRLDVEMAMGTYL